MVEWGVKPIQLRLRRGSRMWKLYRCEGGGELLIDFLFSAMHTTHEQ